MGKLIRAVLRGRDGGNTILLPDTLVTATVVDLSGNRLAPPLFLDTGGFAGRQAPPPGQSDRPKKKVAKLGARRGPFSLGCPPREPQRPRRVYLSRGIARPLAQGF